MMRKIKLRVCNAKIMNSLLVSRVAAILMGCLTLVSDVQADELRADDYYERYHAYWSVLTEAVESNRSHEEIELIGKNDRGLAVDALMRLRQIVRESEALPKAGGTAEDLVKLGELEKRLKDYTEFRHEIALRNTKPPRTFWEGVRAECAWLIRDSGGYVLIALLAVCAVCYIKAYRLVSAGGLIVYADWKDFICSIVWFFCLPIGCDELFALDIGCHGRLIGLASLAIGAWSVWRLVAGAFRHNSHHRLVALGARIAVALLAFFALAKVFEKVQAFRRKERGAGHGALILVFILVLVYQFGVRPMIGKRIR